MNKKLTIARGNRVVTKINESSRAGCVRKFQTEHMSMCTTVHTSLLRVVKNFSEILQSPTYSLQKATLYRFCRCFCFLSRNLFLRFLVSYDPRGPSKKRGLENIRLSISSKPQHLCHFVRTCLDSQMKEVIMSNLKNELKAFTKKLKIKITQTGGRNHY